MISDPTPLLSTTGEPKAGSNLQVKVSNKPHRREAHGQSKTEQSSRAAATSAADQRRSGTSRLGRSDGSHRAAFIRPLAAPARLDRPVAPVRDSRAAEHGRSYGGADRRPVTVRAAAYLAAALAADAQPVAQSV